MRDPILGSWRARRFAARGPMILPRDDPAVVIRGADPDRVLLVGSGPAAGVGVDTHQQALTGALARRLAAATGRGVRVEAKGHPDAVLGDVLDLLRRTLLYRYDAVVVIVGMGEAMRLVSTRRWRTQLQMLLEEIHLDVARDTLAIVVGMPAPTSVGAGGRCIGSIVDRRASQLNEISREVCRSHTQNRFVQLAAPTPPARLPTSDWYELWANEICSELGPFLTR